MPLTRLPGWFPLPRGKPPPAGRQDAPVQPALCRRRFGRKFPGWPGSGFGLGLRAMFLLPSFSKTIRSWGSAAVVLVLAVAGAGVEVRPPGGGPG